MPTKMRTTALFFMLALNAEVLSFQRSMNSALPVILSNLNTFRRGSTCFPLTQRLFPGGCGSKATVHFHFADLRNKKRRKASEAILPVHIRTFIACPSSSEKVCWMRKSPSSGMFIWQCRVFSIVGRLLRRDPPIPFRRPPNAGPIRASNSGILRVSRVY